MQCQYRNTYIFQTLDCFLISMHQRLGSSMLIHLFNLGSLKSALQMLGEMEGTVYFQFSFIMPHLLCMNISIILAYISCTHWESFYILYNQWRISISFTQHSLFFSFFGPHYIATNNSFLIYKSQKNKTKQILE